MDESKAGGWNPISKVTLAVLVAAGLFVLARHLNVEEYLQTVLQWIRGLGPAGPLVFLVIYILATVFFLPGSVLTLGAGVLFGVIKGFIIVSISATLGASCAFLVGRYLARGWVEGKLAENPRFRPIDEAVAREGWKIVGLTRLSPIFPFNMLNYAYGVTKVSLRDYFLASWIGMIPGTVMYVYIGSLAGDLAALGAGSGPPTTAQWILRIVGFLATVLVTLYVTGLARKALDERVVDETVVMVVKEGEEEREDLISPWDEHNRVLIGNVHPPGWVNPEPAPSYNLVVIGGGTAGLVTAAGAAGLGARVALIEKHLLGGDCLNVGCVPSKCLIRSSRAWADIAGAGPFGFRVPSGVEADFTAVMERMRRLRAGISGNDSAGRFQDLGVDVFIGEGRFSGPDTVAVGGKTLKFKKGVIATGARAVAPPVAGLAEAGYLTNETVFNLTDRPARLACIGAGPIGCELAQTFSRLGSEVVLLDMGPHVMAREDEDAAEIVQQAFVREGIRLVLNCRIKAVEVKNGSKVIHFDTDGKNGSVSVDEILVGAGRAPNVAGLGLDAVGVAHDEKKGITVNDRLQTSNSRIYAAGDVCMQWQFTHAADAAARLVLQNALFFGRKKLSTLNMPWCTYTDPEIAHVGMYEAEARNQGLEVETFTRFLKDVDRAIADGEEEGFVKIHVKKGTDKILGATVVARHAGEMISELTLALTSNIGLKAIAGVIHPYPTQAEAIKQVADMYNRTRLTPGTKKWLERFMAWRR